MKRPLADRRPFGPFAQLDSRTDEDIFVVRFAFNEEEDFGIGDPFIFDEEDPEGVIEDDLKEAIRDIFTESELQYVDTIDNELIYEPGPTMESQRFGRGTVLWTRRSPSELNQVKQNIDDIPGVSTPELTFITVSEVT